ncbi:MAG: hypothetical protein ABI330_11870 [Caldimonas sp.]
MRTSFFLAIALLLSLITDVANARAFDAKALARYDASYVKCESQYPEMKGHGDEAYLSLWRMKAEPKYVAELVKLRRSAVYTAEKQRALRTAVAAKGTAAAASSPLSRECIGLWGEYQRNAALKR